MGEYSAEDKAKMRQAQPNSCAHRGKKLGEDAQAYAIFRGQSDHDYQMNRLIFCYVHNSKSAFLSKANFTCILHF